jgi:hypothetical protein
VTAQMTQTSRRAEFCIFVAEPMFIITVSSENKVISPLMTLKWGSVGAMARESKRLG